MIKKMTILIGIIFLSLSTASFSKEKFEIEFAWGDIKNCTDGNPNTVLNPIFTLKNVPEGTNYIQFNMIDTDVPGYYHGGGKVEYSGQTKIEPGAFKYKSPCPPSGTHTYKWTASARDDKKKELAKASNTRKYPEK
jgi:phosphatidylethanolamine-binding protein (PEBP) family uncharacterized protein